MKKNRPSSSDWDVPRAAARALMAIPLGQFMAISRNVIGVLLDQAFLLQATVLVERRDTKNYLVLVEKGHEEVILLSKEDLSTFIIPAKKSPFAGTFVSRYADNKSDTQLKPLKTENKSGEQCLVQ